MEWSLSCSLNRQQSERQPFLLSLAIETFAFLPRTLTECVTLCDVDVCVRTDNESKIRFLNRSMQPIAQHKTMTTQETHAKHRFSQAGAARATVLYRPPASQLFEQSSRQDVSVSSGLVHIPSPQNVSGAASGSYRQARQSARLPRRTLPQQPLKQPCHAQHRPGMSSMPRATLLHLFSQASCFLQLEHGKVEPLNPPPVGLPQLPQ